MDADEMETIRDLLAENEHHVEEVYRRAVGCGYEIPGAAVRVHGDIRRDEEFRVEFRPYDVAALVNDPDFADEFPAFAFHLFTHIEEMTAPGRFPVIVADLAGTNAGFSFRVPD